MRWNKNNYVYQIVLTSLFISLSILLKYLSGFIHIFNGYSIDLEIIAYVYGIIILSFKMKLIFLIITPLLWWFIMPGYSITPIQVFVEYFLVYYIYVFLLILDLFNFNSKKKFIFWSLLLIIVITFIKLIIHTIAGAIWWTNNDYLYSFIFNLEIIFGNLSINIVLIILTFSPILEISKKEFYTKKKSKVFYI